MHDGAVTEAILDAWDEPADAKTTSCAYCGGEHRSQNCPGRYEAKNHPHHQLLHAPVEVIEAPQAHCATVSRETVSQALAARIGESQEDKLAALEDKIYSSNLRIVDDMTYWADIDPAIEEPPEAWVRELGAEDAHRRLRVARASMMSLKDAPIGISAAKSIVSSLAKARAVRDAGRSGMQLNVLAVFPTQVQVYEELVVRDE